MARDDEDVEASTEDPSDAIGQAAVAAGEESGPVKTSRAADPDEGDRESQPQTGSRRQPLTAASGDGGDDLKPAETEGEQKAEQPEWTSIRDVAKARGQFDPAMWKDDETAANEIVDGYRQFRQIEPDYELYRRLSPQFQAWLQSQGQPQPQPQPTAEAPKWYSPPEFKDEWLQDLEFDEKGNIRPKEGRHISPDRINKVANYIQWRRDFRERFERNPQEAVRELVAGQFAEEARKATTEQIETLRLQNEAQKFVDSHASWLFRHNEQGHAVMDPVTRNRVLTPEGQMFAHYFNEAESRGLKSMSDLTDYALNMTKLHMLQAKYQAEQQGNAGAKGKPAAVGKRAVAEALQRASKEPKRAASQANPKEPGRMAQNPKADLQTQLMAAFKDSGITDDQLD